MEPVKLQRDCEAVQIPAGTKLVLSAGTDGWITQALGDSYTVQVPSHGGLFRIAGKDADAIGKDSFTMQEVGSDDPLSEDAIWSALRNVYDPEIPVNIVDLGLVYDLRLQSAAEGGTRVEVKMTLTAQGCGMGPSIAMDARQRIEALPGVIDADVQVVWDPPWNPRMISPEGRARLGMND